MIYTSLYEVHYTLYKVEVSVCAVCFFVSVVEIVNEDVHTLLCSVHITLHVVAVLLHDLSLWTYEEDILRTW